MWSIVVGAFFSYFLGSIPFSYIIARLVKGVDIRVVGEGNVGARNVWHVVGKRYGTLAGVLDVGKGLAAYFIGYFLGLGPVWVWVCGVCVVLGHGFPIFLRGRGGKGAACAMGFCLGMQPLVILISSIIIGLVYLTTRNFHLALGTGMASVPLLWRFLMNKSWEEFVIVTSFLLLLGLKRLVDEPYMRKIKQISGW